jgi:hypothetical protein
MGVCLLGTHLLGVHLISVCLMGMYLMGVHFMGVYLMGVRLIDVYFSWACISRSCTLIGVSRGRVSWACTYGHSSNRRDCPKTRY